MCCIIYIPKQSYTWQTSGYLCHDYSNYCTVDMSSLRTVCLSTFLHVWIIKNEFNAWYQWFVKHYKMCFIKYKFIAIRITYLKLIYINDELEQTPMWTSYSNLSGSGNVLLVRIIAALTQTKIILLSNWHRVGIK